MATSEAIEDVFIDFEFRFAFTREYLTKILLPTHKPPLELVETPGPGRDRMNIFSVRDPTTTTISELNDILLPHIADALRGPGSDNIELEDTKLMQGPPPRTSWTIGVIDNPENINIRSFYGGRDDCPVGNDDGLTAEYHQVHEGPSRG